MSTSFSKQHGAEGTGGHRVSLPEPSFAEQARTLVHRGRTGSLCTLSRQRKGWPFGSMMPYGLDERGRPIFLISTLAMHTQNLLADPRASLLVTQSDWTGDPLGAARTTLMGEVSRVPKGRLDRLRQLYLDRHENARHWVDYDDFVFYWMDSLHIYFIGGFGVMGWITGEDYEKAEVDPLADAASAVIQHMNADHSDALRILARAYAGIDAQQAVIIAVDRLGFHLRLKSGHRVQGTRINFIRPVKSKEETRGVLVEMVGKAREIGE